jgi:5,5'-dehydrodivanillate O-demethylase oxygenase subunit
MRVGGNGVFQMQIRVPIDDTHTWVLFYTNHQPPGMTEFPEQVYPVDYEFPWLDENGKHIVDYIEGQDIMAWVTQGDITDRTASTSARATPASSCCAVCSGADGPGGGG